MGERNFDEWAADMMRRYGDGDDPAGDREPRKPRRPSPRSGAAKAEPKEAVHA